ncbi:MAG TPA: carboxypeptidase-like regulatory domain-containing protein, partial [Candidatus Methylomirabilis sp.]|nr:carboxypeptidase-like regulatory domain-containing protein [Candidatus Methylomirabilis sp.]
MTGQGKLVWMCAGLLLVCAMPSAGRSQHSFVLEETNSVRGDDAGTISGTVVDGTGAAVVGARVELSRDDTSPAGQETVSEEEGQFSF